MSAAQARRIALAAQGFTAARCPRGPVRSSHLWALAERLGIVQIDSVNVVSRSHYLPFYSRLGGYDASLLDGLRDDGDRSGRRLVEYWAHEASLIRPEVWPLLGFRMRRAADEAWGGMRRVQAERPDLVARVLEEVRERGPLTARQAEAAIGHAEAERGQEWGWNWSLVKAALEHLFWAGRLTSAGRTSQFERRYAATESILPPQVLALGPYGDSPVSDADAWAGLVELGARAHGVGSESCLRDYARLSIAQARPAIARLVEEGVLLPVRVEGWKRPAYLHRDAKVPARLRARALVSPFDSVVWQRDRGRELFGFDYSLEFYVPAAKRLYGYYVMPFLLGDRFVARVDLKADRAARTLRVIAIHWEAGRLPGDAPEELRDELGLLAHFLGLDSVSAA